MKRKLINLYLTTQPLEIGKIDIKDEDYDEELQKTFMMLMMKIVKKMMMTKMVAQMTMTNKKA